MTVDHLIGMTAISLTNELESDFFCFLDAMTKPFGNHEENCESPGNLFISILTLSMTRVGQQQSQFNSL